MSSEARRFIIPQPVFERLGMPEIEMFGLNRYLAAQERLTEHHHEGCMEICYLVSGRQFFEVKGRYFWMTGGQVFITRPGERHSTGEHPMEKGELYWMIINLKERRNFLNLTPSLGVRFRDALAGMPSRLFVAPPTLKRDVPALMAELRSGESTSPMAVHVLLCSFLNAVTEGSHQSLTRNPERFEPVLALMQESLDQPLRIGDLARHMDVSEPWFKQLFREAFGMPPAEYLRRLRVDHGKALLAENRFPITQIAFECGFPSSQYFSTVFKRYTGMTPLDWRRKSGRMAGFQRGDRSS